jgi:glycerophosphoryl diester phosphodiesterase
MNYRFIFYLFFLCMHVFSAAKSQDVRGGTGNDFDIQGHRGCRGLMPENTIPAMLKALDFGVTTLEMDVVITRDKKVIVSHEPWFEREITTRPDGSFVTSVADAMALNIYQMSYEEVARYDVGMKPHPRFPKQQKMKAIKPLLEDLIDSVESYGIKKNLKSIQYNIEIKSLPAGDNRFHPVPAEFTELVMAVLKEKKIENQVILQSFDIRPLQILHEKFSGIKISLLVEDSDENDFEGQLKKLGFIPAIYSPNQSLVDEELVKQCHEKGMKIIPWTVNDKKQIAKLRKMGVDGIITDYPDLFKN